MRLVPADVAAVDEFDEWLSPGRAMGYLDIRKIEDPEAAERLVRALSVGARRALEETQEQEPTDEEWSSSTVASAGRWTRRFGFLVSRDVSSRHMVGR
ncbi:hypothetical protein [Micromonospora sp. NPDC093244]|uniref:hypothetical protein n=1 Tax=Micromonospora sp. NPDC093244 TaxID=3155071 RepID=UPI0034354F72